jgi:hypothetical protein
MLNPGEAAALQRYAPLFLEEAEAEIAMVEGDIDIEITNREFRVEGDGATRTVLLDAIAIEGSVDGARFAMDYSDGCVSATLEGESVAYCTDQVFAMEEFDDLLADAPAIRHLIDTVTAAFADMEAVGIEVREYDGRWYVSPVTTSTEAVLTALRALDRQELDAIIDAVPPAFEEFFGLALGGFGEILDDEFTTYADDDYEGGGWTTVPDDEAQPPMTTFPELPIIDDLDDSAIDDEYSDEYSDEFADDPGYYICYEERDAATATACFEKLLLAGEIDEWEFPTMLRFPECGYAEIGWSGDLYQMDDATFIATAESVRPCFLGLLEQGLVEQWELPSEVTHLECFEGRNWYATYDDAEYDERYFDCISQPIAETTP